MISWFPFQGIEGVGKYVWHAGRAGEGGWRGEVKTEEGEDESVSIPFIQGGNWFLYPTYVIRDLFIKVREFQNNFGLI